ncbi:NTPase KAP family P-loop domain-containing protein 1-like [Pantherophis guttatus]|uniref:NTPase KAP family P-loop domain-containing protein 1-like n=1 Tax=Pantherophis guttatus TaxID=94885 RepID=A0A6P9DRN0_PANGU|nr:NTPase KAP family P-loop domain-containing protein 1-like [Pantherophis guttatus]
MGIFHSFLFFFPHSSDLLSEDEIYCSCLLKTLCYTSTPVTVGFYSPYKTRVHSLMEKVAGQMLKESIRREEESRKFQLPQRRSYLTLLWYILFCQPVVTKKHLQRKTIKFLFIKFSAWEYACNNQLWAGLVTSLCDHIRHHFGPLPLSFYHVVGSPPDFVSGLYAQKEWRLKRKTCCITGGLVVIILLAGAGLVTIALFVPGIRDGTLLKYLGSGIAVILGSGFVIAISPVIKHLIISQKKKIESMTNDEKFTRQLGFRSAVKREIEVLTSFIYFMEIFEKRRFKIVFKITGLDICNPEQVVGVLNAINTLLSNRNAPFIFILVVDPSDIVSSLEQASSVKGMADNGYLYLNRTVTLPFSIPEIAIKSKMHCLKETLQKHEALKNVREGIPSLGMNVEALRDTQVQIDKLASTYIRKAFECLEDEEGRLHHYVPDSIIQMTRIINTIPITIRLMTQQPLLRRNVSPCNVASWVVLANQWPCRLSWILQRMEDTLKGQPPDGYEKLLMWDVFVETCPELFSKHKELQNVMALDGDPELFEKFLSMDFLFTVQEGKEFLKYTVNLDHSIRCKMRQLQALATLETYRKGGTNSKKRA